MFTTLVVFYRVPSLQKKPCTLTVAKETFGPGQLVIGLPQNSSLTPSLTAAMLELEETGVITELRRKWLVENSECPQDHVETDGTSLAITQVGVLGVGVFRVFWVFLGVRMSGVFGGWGLLRVGDSSGSCGDRWDVISYYTGVGIWGFLGVSGWGFGGWVCLGWGISSGSCGKLIGNLHRWGSLGVWVWG